MVALCVLFAVAGAEAGVMPTRMDLLDRIYTPRDPRYQVFADALAVGRCLYSVVENELFNDSNGIWATMISESVFGGADIGRSQAEGLQPRTAAATSPPSSSRTCGPPSCRSSAASSVWTCRRSTSGILRRDFVIRLGVAIRTGTAAARRATRVTGLRAPQRRPTVSFDEFDGFGRSVPQ
jgi:hypothetical protein